MSLTWNDFKVMKKIMFNDRFFLTQAVLERTKTMTRQLLKGDVPLGNWEETEKNLLYKVGETVAIAQSYRELYPDVDFEVVGKDFMTETAGWNNKMFVKSDLMKHHIRITDVKTERLQDISEEDCLHEGVKEITNVINEKEYYVEANTRFGFLKNVYKDSFGTPRHAFSALTDKINGKGTWERNPWVVAYTFERID